MIIDFFRINLDMLIQGLAEYHAKMEDSLETISLSEQDRIMVYANALSPEARDEFFSFSADEFNWTYKFFFPRSLRYSFIVLLFLTLENELSKACDVIQSRRNLPLREKEIKGDSIARCKTYLRKVVGVSLDDSHWLKIENLAKVRNCIVHAQGKIALSRDKTHLIQLAETTQGLSISGLDTPESGSLIIEREYCTQSLKDVRQFFDSILDVSGFNRNIFAASNQENSVDADVL